MNPVVPRVRPGGALALALLAVTLEARGAIAAPLHWGGRGGVNASAFAGEYADFVPIEVRFYPYAGLALQMDLTPNLSLRSEAAYSPRGGGFDLMASILPGETTRLEALWRLDYLELPLLLRLGFPIGSGPSPYVEVGPSFGVALGGRTSAKISGVPEPGQSLGGEMNPVDFGFAGGLGVEFPAGSARVGLEARYTRSFTDIWKGDDDLETINQAWTLALSWLR